MTQPGRQTCLFNAEHTIDPDRDYQRIIAWRKRRHGGNSPNYVRGIELVPDIWACAYCVDKLAGGVDPGQQALV